MISNQKPTGRALSMSTGLFYGAAVSLSTTLLSAVILAKLLDTEILEWEKIGYGVMVLLLLSSILGAGTAYSKIKHQRLMVCLLSGAIYFGILMAVTALFFGGQYESVGVTAILILGGSTAVGLLGLRNGREVKRAKRMKIRR